jgi:ribonucleoside-diphosphate reductase beta chain
MSETKETNINVRTLSRGDSIDSIMSPIELSSSCNEEPLLKSNPNRYVIFPIKYPKIWEFYKKQERAIWNVEELDLSNDPADWEEMNVNQKHFIKHVLAFFAAADGIVAENLAIRFIKEVQIPEARFFYGLQIQMEQVHAETYSMLIDTYIKDKDEKHMLFNAIENIPVVKKKAQWAEKWIVSNNSFVERLIGFVVVEGIHFSGSFCAIFWVKHQLKKLVGLSHSNQLISRDEGLHCLFGCYLYREIIVNKLPKQKIYEIFKEGVDIEKEFVKDALPVELIGMKSDEMCQYIEYVADYTLNLLGYEPLYNATNPFDFIEQLALEGKTNFFEHRVSEYQKAKKIDTDDYNLDDDF